MPVVTCQSNTNAHPGDIVWLAKQKKCTKQQIKDNKAKAKAAKQEAARERHAVISSIAGLKATADHKEEVIRAHASRPDLLYCSSNATRTTAALILENRVPVRAWKYTKTAHGSAVPHPRTSPDEIENEEGCATAPPGLGPRINPDEIENEEDDATPPPEWMDKFVMSEQGSVGLGSNNEDLLDFRGLDDDEGYTGMELDINPDGGMASLVMPDVGMPDLVVGPELVNYPSTKVTQSSERGSLRRLVSEFEETMKKGKASEMLIPTSRGQGSIMSAGSKPTGIKRSFATYGGLSGNWKAKVNDISRKRGRSAANANQGGSTPDNSALVLGEFNNDEPTEALEKVRLSKSTTPKAHMVRPSRPVPIYPYYGLPSLPPVAAPTPVQRTQQMGMNLVAMSSSHKMGSGNANNKRGRTRKANPTNLDLPLPPGSEYQTKWTKVYVPQLYAWAGSTSDPFGTNGKMAIEVEVIWKRVFPNVALEDEEDKHVVVKVAGIALHNWRSQVQKAARGVVLAYWNSKILTINTPLDRSRHATQEVKDLRFVYKDIGAGAGSGRGIFCSYLVSKTYASHLKKIAAAGNRYGLQIGGLALATVAVEHSLSLYEDKLSSIHNLNPNIDSVPGQGFVERPWGKKARALQSTITTLGPQHWAMIHMHATIYFQDPTQPEKGMVGDRDNDEDYSMYPHAHLIIDCFAESSTELAKMDMVDVYSIADQSPAGAGENGRLGIRSFADRSPAQSRRKWTEWFIAWIA